MTYLLTFYGLMALQLADLASTVYFMAKPSLGLTEGNPLLSKLFGIFGVLPTLLVFKGALIILFLVRVFNFKNVYTAK